jgi:ABC-type antimicrobial peptide transport system permease subunit
MPDIWYAARLTYDTANRYRVSHRVIGRLKEGVTLEQAQAETDVVAAEKRKTDTILRTADFHIRLEPMRKYLVAEVRPAILALTGAVIFLLLIACANVANLLLAQASSRQREYAVRAALGAVRNEVAALDKDMAIDDVKTLEQYLVDSVAQPKFSALLLTIFACVAMILTAVGLYGVIAYSAAQRTHEIGVRVALGAQGRDVIRLVIGQGMRLALIGLAFGLVAAFALTRLMRGLLYGVSAADPMTFAGAALLLCAVALAACYLPARRATKVDPMIALRCG